MQKRERRTPVAFYARVRDILESARYSVVRTVNTTHVVTNWLIGREIVTEEQQGQQRAEYGERLLRNLADKLQSDFGHGYSYANLKLIRQFYLVFPDLLDELQIGYALRSQSASLATVRGNESTWGPGRLHPNLGWTHYRVLIRIGLSEARAFYQIEAIRNNWSARELERQVTSLLFERLAKSRNKRALMRMAAKGHEIQRAADIFKDPLVMEFLGLPESARLLESDLEEALISNLQAFLLEMGKGFAFVARQERITLDSDLFYIDLVFYHTVLKCYVLIDLKAHKLTHEDLGQMLLYVNYFDKNRRTVGDNPTLGLILCSDKNDAVVRYTLGEHQEKIFARRYKLHLPSINELQQELQRNLLQLQGTRRVSKPTLLLPSRKNNRQKATGSSTLRAPRNTASPKTTRGSIKGTASSRTGKAAQQKTHVRTAKNKKR